MHRQPALDRAYGAAAAITGLVFDAESKLLLSASLDRRVSVWFNAPGIRAKAWQPHTLAGSLTALQIEELQRQRADATRAIFQVPPRFCRRTHTAPQERLQTQISEALGVLEQFGHAA